MPSVDSDVLRLFAPEIVSCVTFVFLPIVLLTFFAVTPLLAPITGVTSRTAASTAASDAGTTQRQGLSLTAPIDVLLFETRCPDRRGPKDPCRRRGGQTNAACDYTDVQTSSRPSSAGSFCLSFSTGSNRSPSFSIRLIASGISKRSRSAESLRFAARSTSLPPQRDRGGGALAGAQRVDGDRRLLLVVLAPVDEDLALARSTLVIFETTSFGVCFSSSCATALAKGLVCS